MTAHRRTLKGFVASANLPDATSANAKTVCKVTDANPPVGEPRHCDNE